MMAPCHDPVMDDLAVGRLLRAVRVHRMWRQEDLARAAGVSRQTVSRVELGRLDGVPLGSLRRVFAAVDVRVTVALRGVGAELPRLADAHHAAMHEDTARLFVQFEEWETDPEVTFSVYGERGSIDILAWHARSRSLLVIELKTELVDLQETVSTLDRKVRLATKVARERGWEPASVSTWLVIADSRHNRRSVARHATFLRSRFPADGHAVMGWLRRPVGRMEALSYLSSDRSTSTGQRLAPVRRVQRSRKGLTTARR
jgi:transcriptional regulator with XRE-family HTH domain